MRMTPERLFDKLTVEKANVNTYKTQLGFGAPEIDENEQDHANLGTAIENVPIATDGKESVTEVKNAVFNGDGNESVNPYPSFTLTALPFPNVKAGALSRYENRKKRAKLASGYTEQIGIAMGYVDAVGEHVSPDSVQLVIETAHPAASGYGFALIVSNRVDADSWQVKYRVKGGGETLHNLDTATGKSAEFTVPPLTPGQPMQIEVIVQGRKNNQNYGQPSDPKAVTLNP